MTDQEICELCESGWRSAEDMTDLEILPDLSKRVCIHCKEEFERGAAKKTEYIKANRQKKNIVNQKKYILPRFWGFFQILGLFLFIYGSFISSPTLAISGGIIMLLEVYLAITSGADRFGPFLFFAIVGVLVVISLSIPWYFGVFWSVAIFKVINIPTNLRKIFNPASFEKQRLENMKKMLDEIERFDR